MDTLLKPYFHPQSTRELVGGTGGNMPAEDGGAPWTTWLLNGDEQQQGWVTGWPKPSERRRWNRSSLAQEEQIS